MKRIYHHYRLWEDYKAGFYDIDNKKKENINLVLDLFKDEEETEKQMSLVLSRWKYSCEHNLTNLSLNRIAYLGQAACCFYSGVPNLTTMYAWKLLDEGVKERSDKIAAKNILIWEQNQKLKNTYKSGRKKGTAEAYQMKLRFN